MSTLTPRPQDDVLKTTRGWMERALLAQGPRTELILVRHGLQLRSFEEETRTGGPMLSEHGIAQATAAAESLAEFPDVTAMYCSDITRAKHTAQIIAERHPRGLTPIDDSSLREIDIYGKAGDGAIPPPERQLEASREFHRTRRWDSFPQTEPSAAFRSRLIGAFTRIAQAHEAEQVIVVCHGGAISTFLAAALQIEDDMWFYSAHTGITRVLYGDDRWAVRSVNETAHLNGELLTF